MRFCLKYLILLLFFSSAVCAEPLQYAKIADEYAQKAHKAYNDKDYLVAGEYYQKAYENNDMDVYLDNAITAYLNYSFDEGNEKNYGPAIKYCEKVLKLRLDDKNARELLSDIYFSKACDLYYRGFSEKACIDMEKSLVYAVLDEQRERTQEKLAEISGKKKHKVASAPYIEKASNSKPIPIMIELMELKIYGETYEKLSIIERVGNLEKSVFEENYQNEALVHRLERLKKKVLPELA